MDARTVAGIKGSCQLSEVSYQTCRDSPFTQKSICSRATEDGRITVADMKLIATRNGVRSETVLMSKEERNAALREHFGIILQ